MNGINFPQLPIPETKLYLTVVGFFAAILTPNLLPIFNTPQFQMILPILITLVSYVITGQRVIHHHRDSDSHPHKSKGACFFGGYGLPFLVQILLQYNLLNANQLPDF